MRKEYRCSVRKHSRKQLEIKIDYPLDKKNITSNFNLDLYCYFPAQLHINEKRVGINNVLNSMIINTRFSSPVIPLDKVLDSENTLSPLVRIETLLQENHRFDTDINNSILYELQMLCNLYRAEMGLFVKIIKKEFKKNLRDELCTERTLIMIQTVKRFLERVRNLHLKFLDSSIHENLRTALNWADESISIITSGSFTKLYDLFNTDSNVYDKVQNIIDSEVIYRKSMNYKYQYDKKNSRCGEVMAYRDSVLKKWSQSAMYMNNESSRTPKHIGHLIAGLAAGLAMTVAVILSMFAENYFPKQSGTLIIALVVSYILKDRIKEVVRNSFGSLLPKWTTDQQSNLFDPAQKNKVGKSSGTVSFCSPLAVPNEINSIRYRKPNPFRKVLPPNDILHYKRKVYIKSEKLLKSHSRLESITEIIRFQIDDWLKDMEDSKTDLWYIENGKKIKINGGRVYKVHLVISLSGSKVYYYNLILNKSGVLRIEKENI